MFDSPGSEDELSVRDAIVSTTRGVVSVESGVCNFESWAGVASAADILSNLSDGIKRYRIIARVRLRNDKGRPPGRPKPNKEARSLGTVAYLGRLSGSLRGSLRSPPALPAVCYRHF